MVTVVHEKLIKELCFICGCILRGTVYDVEKFKENLEKAFNFNFDIVTGVTPMLFFLQYLLSHRQCTRVELKKDCSMKLERNQSNGKSIAKLNCVPCDLYAAVKRRWGGGGGVEKER